MSSNKRINNELSRFSEAVRMNYDIDAECWEFKLCDSSPIRQVGIFLRPVGDPDFRSSIVF